MSPVAMRPLQQRGNDKTFSNNIGDGLVSKKVSSLEVAGGKRERTSAFEVAERRQSIRVQQQETPDLIEPLSMEQIVKEQTSRHEVAKRGKEKRHMSVSSVKNPTTDKGPIWGDKK